MVDKSEKFSWLVRLGYFARAVLYTLLGYIALSSAQEISEGTDGVFKAVENLPGGIAILWIMAVGLVGYSLFRFASTVFDIENNGTDKIGWAKRIGHAGSGIGHLALAWTAFQFASAAGGSEGGGAQAVAAGVLSTEFGGTVLGLLGLVFFAVAVFQAKKGITGEFMHRIAAGAPSITRLLGGFGYCARGVVYAVIGWSLVRAGFMSAGAEQVRTLGDALAGLAGQGAIFTVTAVGLLVFGIFSLILAWYRIIPDLDADGRVPDFRS